MLYYLWDRIDYLTYTAPLAWWFCIGMVCMVLWFCVIKWSSGAPVARNKNISHASPSDSSKGTKTRRISNDDDYNDGENSLYVSPYLRYPVRSLVQVNELRPFRMF